MELETKYLLESAVVAVLDNTLGAMLVSVIVSALLFGILTTQCYYYALRFKRDPAWLKCIVAALWIIDCTHQITVQHYGDFEYLPRSTWLVSPLPAFIVQMYFTRRLYHLNPKLWPVAAFTVILSIVTLATGEGTPSLALQSTNSTRVCDVAVTIPVAWTLYTSRTGFKHSFALLEVVTFIVRNETLIHLAANIGVPPFIKLRILPLINSWNTVLAKLYSLNRRGTLTTGGAGALHFSDNIALCPGQASKKDEPRHIQVSVSTHHYYEGQSDDPEVGQKPFVTAYRVLKLYPIA
ncbi:hypothetical protein BS47DRAFT_1359044 [Hydnum rufescens UP504]|uniref:Uncharacterized protein n=1 Tax=Hydnum rufescens UP504 TaxID=1448309 RepID=A0A9P6E1C3_9AGAM|nr:hypothetical protein BS47DRAFT_1359044 [Hydnum rufescens UP504]